jgi:meso-butanediol dehydrogenase / (S,S)-butanediol dehydrogenase / diacetyl reductase
MATLTGLTALVTGAGRGIGDAIATRLARDGATVVVADIDLDAAEAAAARIRSAGGTAQAHRVDVSDPGQSAALVDLVYERHGRLDVMFNNAGVVRVQPLLEVTPADWDFVQSVNARGLFFAMQAGARRMVAQAPLAAGRPRGKIVNIASIAGRGGRPMFAAYAASKAAAISVTQSAALAFAPELTVNAICPGVVETEMWRTIDREWTGHDGRPVGSAWQDRLRAIPMGRPERPDDLAGMAAFLAGPDSDYVTGQSYHVDGGVLMN